MLDRLILSHVSFAAFLFFGMLLLLELGRHLGRKRLGKDEERGRAGLGEVEGAVFALLGLLLAFTFSGAATRFDQRRQWIVDEANAIGTAWLRLDLLPSTAQPGLRELFRQYLDSRLRIYQQLPDLEAARKEVTRATALQGQIWSQAVTALQGLPSPLQAHLIPALNDVFDIATTRTMAAQAHPPVIIFILMGILALMSALLAGYAMAGSKTRSWIHTIGFAFIMSASTFIILDLEFPRLGFIRVDNFDLVLVELRQSMN